MAWLVYVLDDLFGLPVTSGAGGQAGPIVRFEKKVYLNLEMNSRKSPLKMVLMCLDHLSTTLAHVREIQYNY